MPFPLLGSTAVEWNENLPAGRDSRIVLRQPVGPARRGQVSSRSGLEAGDHSVFCNLPAYSPQAVAVVAAAGKGSMVRAVSVGVDNFDD